MECGTNGQKHSAASLSSLAALVSQVNRPLLPKHFSIAIYLYAVYDHPGAFGGLLATAIGKLDGKQNYLGWRWIFIIEGVLTCLCALASFFLIPSFPEDAKWLNPEERVYVKARLQKDQGNSAAERPIKMKDVLNVFKDFKIFIGGFMYFGLIVPAYGYYSSSTVYPEEVVRLIAPGMHSSHPA